MSDKELLELAAKAAGIESLAQPNCGVLIASDEEGFSAIWNPLKDDGDALRLAVAIGARVSIEIQFDGEQDYTIVEVPDKGEVIQYHNGDPCTSTRLAITTAAAEIGKAMP